jgi:hypothetical protein
MRGGIGVLLDDVRGLVGIATMANNGHDSLQK